MPGTMPSSCTDPEPIGPRRTPSTRRESIDEKLLRLLRSLRISALALITTQESMDPRRTPSTRSKTMQEKSADALNRRLLKPGTVLEWMVHPSPTGRRPTEVPKGRWRAAPDEGASCVRVSSSTEPSPQPLSRWERDFCSRASARIHPIFASFAPFADPSLRSHHHPRSTP